MGKIKLTKGNEVLPRRAGALLVAAVLDIANVFSSIPEFTRGARGPERLYSKRDVLKTAVVSLAAAQPDFVDIKEFHSAECFYGEFLGVDGKILSESLFRTRLDEIGQESGKAIFEALVQENAKMLKFFGIDPGALPNGLTPFDMDVSPFINIKTMKEGAGKTYKKEDGFSPMFGYMGARGFPIVAEFREGTHHCQKGTAELLETILPVALSMTDGDVLFRFDSGNDAVENMEILGKNPRCRFLIKRNFRRVDKDSEALHLMNIATQIDKPREGKTVFTGSTQKAFLTRNDDGSKASMTYRVVYQITERISTWDGQQLLQPEREIDEWFTNLSEKEATDNEVIELYHDHGTSEQYHSEYKTDLDIEHLPSGKFDTNSLILMLSTIAFNCLRIIETIAREMPKHYPIHFRNTARRRVRTIIENMILIPGLFTTHARQKKLSLGNTSPWADIFIYVYNRISSFSDGIENTIPAGSQNAYAACDWSVFSPGKFIITTDANIFAGTNDMNAIDADRANSIDFCDASVADNDGTNAFDADNTSGVVPDSMTSTYKDDPEIINTDTIESANDKMSAIDLGDMIPLNLDGTCATVVGISPSTAANSGDTIDVGSTPHSVANNAATIDFDSTLPADSTSAIGTACRSPPATVANASATDADSTIPTTDSNTSAIKVGSKNTVPMSVAIV